MLYENVVQLALAAPLSLGVVRLCGTFRLMYVVSSILCRTEYPRFVQLNRSAHQVHSAV